ncbi:MAG: family 43 glycosylhydrolase [Bacteroidales bacterium]|nr:family 43 glycosylhydrolase [Bacteroidales bacterium]
MNLKLKPVDLLILVASLSVSCNKNVPDKELQTICNPVDISYRFQLEEPSRREAADPVIILFKDMYYLFASKSGGYWSSPDLISWNFIATDQIPVEDYAPTAVVIEDTVYFMAGSVKNTIFKSTGPETGKWEIARESLPLAAADPVLFLDDDGRLYFFWGCSNVNPIYCIELDYQNNFEPVGEPVILMNSIRDKYGWEVPGDYNTLYNNSPWIEGSWMNKINGRYYLQYAGPGTEFKSYSDGVYISDKPLGPYVSAEHNPFAYKPEGFACGAGHGSTFTDKYGNYWHVGTVTISVKHIFERRLALYPAFVDQDSVLYTVTKFGDYPIIVPQKKVEGFDDIFPGWMILSFKKAVTASSFIDSLPPENMTDENIRTYWSAHTGNDNEWAVLDLDDVYDVYAIQLNFAEHNTGISGRLKDIAFQYTVESSVEGNNWKLLINKSENQTDNSHDYTQLDHKISCRYLRVKNKHIPGGNFALSGFRVFGLGNGEKPSPVKDFKVERDPRNGRSVMLTWNKVDNATGYNINYGSRENKLYHNYIFYSDTTITINTLNKGQDYYFNIESFNENGITTGKTIKPAFK